ncbi:succinate dehydrogenase, hydrophobic membrane anchor protein [Aquibaculum arenosum]|uniref:Succinate dehydrogenase hydrophobic membrane anchor subunit n=1 Tax=Aquibaculum arenosum TaxID=3032591 RepID=A0ABT5YID0_9PROT|nr:succinate dehydrogenase, hydrophobic membrane anchor protein [Fodinicurvata sp. CAU 1616]MDF2094657.1 succinate dehydrogenase, hydrophobic membrane anchor protein [Fodinicurvata sp. CAU 1616]
MSLRTPLARVRHLGSAKDGTHHWWLQRVTALALVPLLLWFVISVIGMLGADHRSMVDWVSNPVTAALLILLIIATFYHAVLGLQVVIEDYMHDRVARMAVLLLVQGLGFLLATVGVISVLSLLF